MEEVVDFAILAIADTVAFVLTSNFQAKILVGILAGKVRVSSSLSCPYDAVFFVLCF